ncbi:hypothetical protein J4E85_006506 [Alternaria conjuncta]|uniref:uncharacterized protein n=1 Tax=Alternaria conjuncta TaxID=181017 RepID=UPI00221EEB21|nr:uncharacterized protein J4E85_006506 [Alternaria conjuncta]KAI4926214.1 hypothetical protein J4E85_006506 [Alternaria conjuncta]
MSENDSDSDGGISLRDDQKPYEGLVETSVKLRDLMSRKLSDYQDVGAKIVCMNNLLKEMDPDYGDRKQKPYKRIKITYREYPNTGEEIKAGKKEYEVAVKVKRPGSSRRITLSKRRLDEAVDGVLSAVKEARECMT